MPMHVYPLALQTARQVQIPREDIARIDVCVPRIGQLSIPAVERTWIQLVPHLSSPLGGPLFDWQVLMHALRRDKLPVQVPELPAGAAEEKPSSDAVIASEERHEHEQCAGRDGGAVVPEERH